MKLENFRQHANTEIDFRDGMTAIIGPNGSGKSTLLEAITFALFGEAGKGRTLDQIAFYWAESARFTAELEFQFIDGIYRVMQGQTKAKLVQIKDGEHVVLAESKSGVRAAIQRLLGFNAEQFRNSFCTNQKELAFLAGKASGRREEIARMLGLDILELADKQADGYRKDAKSQLQALQGLTLGNLEALRTAVKEAEKVLASCEKEVAANEQALQRLTVELTTVQDLAKRAESYQRLQERFGKLSESLKEKASQEAALLKKAAELDTLAKRLAELAPLDAAYRQAEEEIKRQQKFKDQEQERAQHEAVLAQAHQQVSQLKAEIEAMSLPDLLLLEGQRKQADQAVAAAKKSLESAREAWIKAKSALDGEIKANSDKASKLKKEIEMLKAGTCPTCGLETGPETPALVRHQQEFDACAKLNQELKAQRVALEVEPADLKEATEAVAKGEADVKTATDHLVQAQSSHRVASEKKRTSDEMQTKAAQLEKVIAGLPKEFDEAKLKAAQKALEEQQPAHQEYLRLAYVPDAIKTAQDELGALQQQQKGLKEQQAEIQSTPDFAAFESSSKAQEAISTAAAFAEKVRGATQLRDNAVRMRAEAQRTLESNKAQLALLEENQGKIAAVGHRLQLMEVTQKEFRTLRDRLNLEIRPSLQVHASQILSSLTNDRYRRLDISEDFTPVLVDDDGQVKPVISGGEEDVVALALRLALCAMIQERQGYDMSLLILDEAFSSLDGDRRTAVMQYLSAIKTQFRQILVISHIQEINDVADACLYVRRDPKTRASVVTDAAAEEDIPGLAAVMYDGSRDTAELDMARS
ncbi:MAG: SMC family ATPase [Armatimonadetes bacterium]|nr:SMC family ATPase [Armatimonadota bacterium]